jgi:N-sulfoglucosamine sulfohydrolase
VKLNLSKKTPNKLFIGIFILSIFSLVLLDCEADNGATTEAELTDLLKPVLPDQPNILWLVAEDLSPIIPPYGDNTIVTPNLSRLAREGVRYTRVFPSSGVCAPSRAAIATGKYQNSIGALHMRTSSVSAFSPDTFAPYEAVPPAGVKMHSEYFRAAGYYTSNNSKEDYQFRKTVTAWDESSRTAHWRNRSPGQPFFSIFNFPVTHESQVWARADLPLLVDELLDVPVPPYLPDTEIAKKDIRRVYSNIVALDEQLGNVLDQLEEDGLLESTIIFFYSDHGGPLPRQKRSLYDSGMNLPLIIRFPDKWRAGDIDDQLISFVDFKSTALSLVNIEPPEYVDGRAFLGTYANSSERKYVHGAADRFDELHDTIRAVRDKRFKYLRNYFPERSYYMPLKYREQMPIMQEMLFLRDNKQLTEIQALWFRDGKDLIELFDTQSDPHELNNLIGNFEYVDKISELSDEMDRWMAEINDQGLIPEQELVLSLWPGRVQPVTETPIATNKSGIFVLRSDTEGASIGYQFVDDLMSLSDQWQLYKSALIIPPGKLLVTIADRIGYKPSEILIID